MQRAGDQDPLAAGQPVGHQDGLGRGHGPVVERGVGDVHAGELADERLVLEDGLQGALADLGLVGRVGRDELGPGAEVVDDRGDEVVVDAGPQEGVDSPP